MNRIKQTGFTLIEIAFALVIVAILLGYTMAMFPIQQELKQYRAADKEMDEIIKALIGFAQINGRLPCPDTSGDVNGTGDAGDLNGLEDIDDLLDNGNGAAVADGFPDNCKSFFGFLPSASLGLNGNIDADGVLQDPWGSGYGYAISDVDAGAGFGIDLVSPNGIREEGLTNVVPDLTVCDTSLNDSAANTTCAEVGVAGNDVVVNVAAVLISLGKDRGNIASDIQNENLDDFDDGTNDKVFVYTTKTDVAGAEFDDVVKWISTTSLFSKMIEADQLP